MSLSSLKSSAIRAIPRTGCVAGSCFSARALIDRYARILVLRRKQCMKMRTNASQFIARAHLVYPSSTRLSVAWKCEHLSGTVDALEGEDREGLAHILSWPSTLLYVVGHFGVADDLGEGWRVRVSRDMSGWCVFLSRQPPSTIILKFVRRRRLDASNTQSSRTRPRCIFASAITFDSLEPRSFVWILRDGRRCIRHRMTKLQSISFLRNVRARADRKLKSVLEVQGWGEDGS